MASDKTQRERGGRPIMMDGNPVPAELDEDVIRKVVHGFYGTVQSDDLLAPIFNAAIPSEDWPVHLEKMCDFWSSMLLRTGRYDGRPLPPHLALPGLEDAHFERWLALFQASVERHCTPEVGALFLNRARRIAGSFRLAVAFHRGEDLGDRPLPGEAG